MAYWWRVCGLLVESLWFIGGDGVIYWWRWCDLLVESTVCGLLVESL